MSGASDQFTTIGAEAVAYGTRAATLTRGIEQMPGNKPSPRVEHRPSQGFRPGFLGDPTDTHIVDVRGGTYSLVHDMLSKSHGLILSGFNAATITTPVGGTLTRLHTITPSDNALPSRTIHDAVAQLDGDMDHVDLLGCKLIDWGLSISPKGNVQSKSNWDYKTLDSAASSVTPAYPSSPYVYRDTDVTTTVGGTAACQRSVDFTIPTGAKIDRDMICPGGREEPVVMGRVQPTGNLSPDFIGTGALDDWLAGTARSLVVYIEGPIIEGALHNFLRVTFPVIRYTGDAYDRALDGPTGQPLAWQAFDNGTDPLWTIEYQTTDIAS